MQERRDKEKEGDEGVRKQSQLLIEWEETKKET